MSWFPELLRLLVRDDAGDPVANVAVSLMLYARRKNNYNLVPQLSDMHGVIEVTRKWVEQQIHETTLLAMMDYASTLEDCETRLGVTLLDAAELPAMVDAMSLYRGFLGITEEKLHSLTGSSNALFRPVSKVVELHGGQVAEVELVTEHR